MLFSLNVEDDSFYIQPLLVLESSNPTVNIIVVCDEGFQGGRREDGREE